jgi:hypothetical protein
MANNQVIFYLIQKKKNFFFLISIKKYFSKSVLNKYTIYINKLQSPKYFQKKKKKIKIIN